MIQFFRVHKQYPNGVAAMQDVTFHLREGEFAFLTGSSGAGKTTLIRLVLAMEKVSQGQILVAGRNIQVLRKASIPYLRRNIGVVFQDFRLLQNRTVFDNIAIALEIIGLPRKEIVTRVEQMLELVQLDPYKKEVPQSLSGGEQQRVAIARALVNEPAILLADEPTGNLDPELSVEIMNLLLDVQRKGTTVLVATHDRSLIQRYDQRVLALEKGMLIRDEGGRPFTELPE